MFHRSFKNIFRVCQGNLKDDSRIIERCLGSWGFQRAFKSTSSKNVSRNFQKFFKEVLRMFQGSFKGASRKFRKMSSKF